jgi:folate-dependent phosphoribosylglycinamide formyltransferase PurN
MLTNPLRAAVLCSRRAPGLAHLLARPRCSREWEIVCCVTSEDTFDDLQIATRHHLTVIHHPVHRFYMQHAPQARFGDLAVRAEYDLRTTELLAPYAPDVVVLAGYLLLLTHPMLDAYPSQIINVHHSDLLLRDASGAPRYPGLRAVRDAILAGEHETRCTSHVVTHDLDDGPVLARSNAYLVPDIIRWARATDGAEDVLRKAIGAHQEWMLRSAFGPLMEQSLNLWCDTEAAPRICAECVI